ncbi:MAG: choice-of-anchor V domain-containing protein [Bacteroidota bacterium]
MRAIYMLSLLLGAAVVFLGSSSGPGAVQGQDRTGGPLANGFCGNCHAQGAFNPTISVQLLQDGNEVSGYMPGETYTMRVTIDADMEAQVYGFQAVALSGSGNDQAGSWTPITGTQVTPLGGRDYIEHSQRSDENVWEVEWTAPEASQGEISFYAAGVAANNAQGSLGDGSDALDDPIVLADLSTSTRDLPELATSLRAFPNPVVDQLNLQLDLEVASDANVRIYNASGQALVQRTINLGIGTNLEQFDLSNFPSGMYTVEVSNGEAASRASVVKQ